MKPARSIPPMSVGKSIPSPTVEELRTFMPLVHRAVAGFVRVAKFVELEKFRRERLAARVALAFVGIDVNPQSLCHGGVLGRIRAWPAGRRVPHVNFIRGTYRGL